MMKEQIPVIAVVGPTASGKTGLAVKLAEEFDAEVLSFDSMQLYKGMDVATAKPTEDETHGIPHHMISAVDPLETYSVARYQQDAARIIEDIRTRGKNVVMVGGTGLYLDTVMQNITFLDGGDNTEVRDQLKKELEENGIDALYAELQSVDPEYAERISKSNAVRVMRALEVYRMTGYTMSYQISRSHEKTSPYRPFYIGLNARNRDVLYDRINLRVDLMIQEGLLEEARVFQESGVGSTAAQAIGIKEMMPYLNGSASLEDCTEKLKLDTRHYAKRQLTWFRRNQDVHWLFLDDYEDKAQLYDAAVQLIKNEEFLDERR